MIAAIKKLENNNALFGLCCILIATIGLSMKAILIKLFYQAAPGVNAESILALRFLIALPLFVLILHIYHRNQSRPVIPRNAMFTVVLLGVAGFYVSAILDFSALAYIPAGLERLILFLYPTFVVLISLARRNNEVTRRTLVALALSYVGVVIVFIEQAPQLNSNMIKGIVLVFGAAIVFAAYTVASVKHIRQYGSIPFTAYAMFAATMATVVHVMSTTGLSFLDQDIFAYMLAALMAIFCTVLPLIFIAEGIKRIGASNAAIISTTGPVLTLAFAYVFLGEIVGVLQAIGAVLIIAGVYVVSRGGK